jgi:hypothetical protein
MRYWNVIVRSVCSNIISPDELLEQSGFVPVNALCDWSLQLIDGRNIPIAMPTTEDLSAFNERTGDPS